VSTPTDERRDLLTVVAVMNAAPGKADELRSTLESLVKPTLAEAGVVNYDLHESVDAPGRFVFYENWESAEHLDAHLATPHLVDFAGRLGDLLDADGLTLHRLRRIG
jgi:quinol monooxygenase YgiN